MKSFSFFSIKDARSYTINLNEAIVDDISGIVVSFIENSYYGGVDINVTLPGKKTSKFSRIRSGWVIHYKSGSNQYQMTIIQALESAKYIIIEIRLIDHIEID